MTSMQSVGRGGGKEDTGGLNDRVRTARGKCEAQQVLEQRRGRAAVDGW